MTYFVTGATGFIGSLLTRRLLQEGHQVIALIRPKSLHKATEKHHNLWWVEGDLLDPSSLNKAVEGCERIFHTAAYASVWAPDYQKFYDINVSGTRNVLEAAIQHGISKVVYTSTAATLSPAGTDAPSDENSEKRYFFNPYERSKYMAEEKVQWYAREHDLHTVIVHPTRVYGPGPLTESNAVTRIIKLYLEGKWRFQISDGKYIGNYSYVRDVVEGHLKAMHDGKKGEHYVLGGTNLSFNELFDLMGEISGKNRLTFPLPEAVMRGFARFEQIRANLLGGNPKITPGWINKYLNNWVVSSKKAQRELGYQITPARDAMRQTIQWLTNTEGKDNKKQQYTG